MNTTTKKFLSAVMTAAIVFSQASAPVAAATSRGTSSASQSDTVKSSRKDFGNSSYWSKKDKYGCAYPYSYYRYAGSSEAMEKLYVKIYNALHDRKSSITFDDRFEMDNWAYVLPVFVKECPELYYYVGYSRETIKDENGRLLKEVAKFEYLPEKTLASHDKIFAEVLNDFDAYLDKKDVTTTKQFLNAALAFVGSRVEYDHESKGDHSKHPDCENIVGAFVDGKVVCEGYVQAFNYLCRAYGIACCPKYAEGGANHALSTVIYKNTWYNYDPTAYKKSYKQMTTDAQVKDYGYEVELNNNHWKSPAATGKPMKPATPKPKTEDTTPKLESDTKEKLYIDLHYESYERFSFIAETDISYPRKQGYTYVKITVPDGRLDLTIKYLKQMKEDGLITYKALYKGKDFVKVEL